MPYWVITFPSVYQAYRAEKLLLQAGLPGKLIAVPRQLSGSCEGLAMRLDSEETARQAAERLKQAGVPLLKEAFSIAE